ncbi:MAG: sodium-dependent transporter [Candidatus Omnitrophica bacterium]|nr:sodium-dependent transporter [Candidatus Omnitrophota bacterium]MBU4478247.1 sodium-dependent transporter [Candidatus Omnitrophota bacterium]MCG2703315.1 sodium-dependent transporter [Candidatus Omnitrophota bacterium]
MSKDVFIHHRPQWKSHIGFLLAAIGSAIGLGNIWRFPYLCYKNGGGAFLISYFTALLIVGIPLMILEIGLGHKMKGSAPASMAVVSKKWEWLGWWQVIFVMFGIIMYYSVVISWCLNYFFLSFNAGWTDNPNAFFFKQFLMLSDSPFNLRDFRMPILFSLLGVWGMTWLIVFGGVQKGLERANKIFMPLLFVLTAVIVLWSIRLPGAKEGIMLYLRPDFPRLREPGVWIDAFSQIFFTLSLGFGIMIAYASYLPKKSQIVKDSFVICIVNCLYSLFAGLGVFSVLGYMAGTSGKDISEVVSDSIGLAFVAYPKAISLLPHFSKLFGVMFFATLVIAGLSSAISILEAFTSAIIDKFHYPRKVVVSVLSVIGFLGSIIFTTHAGLYWLDIVDHFLTQYGLVLAGILECIAVGWIFKTKRLREHINHFSDWKLNKWWDVSIRFICPLVLIILFISSLVQELAKPYGGYSWVAIIMIGRDWLIYTLFFAIIVAAHPWKVEPKDRIINE